MKNQFTLLFIFFSIGLNAQTWVNCNEMLITVDDFNTDLDFENQPADCGCSNAGGECTLVRIKLTETINGIETPVSYSSIQFTNPLSPPLEPNYSFKDYIDIFNPYSTCTEYQSEGQLNHNYKFSPVAPPGHELHLMVCPGSEQGQMRGRFYSLSPGTPLAAPTNVQASDGQTSLSVSFDAIPGKYYMAYRSTENCNQSWTPIDPSMPWPQASSSAMTIQAQSFFPDQQFEYRVVCSDNGFVVASGTNGAWSDGDLGHLGTLNVPYTSANDCTESMGNDCTNDTEPPICMDGPFVIQLDPGQDYYTFNINDFVADACSDEVTFETVDLDPSTPNNGSIFVNQNDQFFCGTYIVQFTNVFDDAFNMSECAFTFTVDCGGGTPGGDTCIVEPTFSNLLWSTYLGGDGEEEIVDIYVNEITGIQYVIGKTNSTNFYSTNTEIGTASTGFKTFVMAINPDASLLWSTLINNWDDPQAIHMDPDGYLTLVGITDNPTLPGPAGLPGYDKDHNGGKDILILKMDGVGQNIVYSTFYGGVGNETYNGDPITPFTFTKERLKVDFRDNHIYVIGTTDSNDLPLQSAIDTNPGDGFSFVLEASTSSNTLYFASYIKKISGAITPLVDGGFAIVVENADGDYGNFISPNAIESGYDAFFSLPILMVFDNNNMVEYATYIGPHRVQGQSQICDNSASNGVAGISNLFDFQLKSDDCGNLYWYSLGNGFRQPLLSSEYLLPARKYRPSLDQLQDPCNMSVNNPFLKINLIDEADPFIEYMLFFGYNGISSATSSFAIDNNQRPHFHTRKEAFFTDPDISLPVGYDFVSDLYFIFENDLSDVQVMQNSPGTDLLPVGIKVFDNKAYLIGSMSDALGSVTPSWNDEDGNTNSIIQSSYGSGTNDGFISVVDNNELCEGCNQPSDTTQCENIVLNFDGIDDKVLLNSPLSGNSDYTITADFKCGAQNNGLYPRIIGFFDNEAELAVRSNGELAYYNGGSWRNSGVIVDDGIWHNATLRRNGSSYSLFLDGQLLSTIGGPATLNFMNEMAVGGLVNISSSESFAGSIDNVRVWSTALSDLEITSNFTNLSNPLSAYFNFEEGEPNMDNSTIVGPLDVLGIYQGSFSGFTLDGEQSNYICDEYEIVFPTSCDNQVMHFTEAKEYIRLENAGTQSDFTVGAWFKLSDQSNGGNEDRIIAFGPTNRLEIGTTNIGQFWRYDPNSIVQNERIYANTSLRDGDWHHFTYVAVGAERIIYLDFQEIDRYQASSQVYGPSFHVGRWTGGASANSQFSGEIDEVRGYDIAIDSSMICETFSQVPANNSSNLSIYFDFEEGVPGGDNLSLIQAVNNGYLSDGDLINFTLLDSMSNYICDPINFEGCDDPCENDTEPPVATCSGNIIEVELGLDGTIFLTEDMFDFSATDNCNFSIEFEGGVLDCDDIGQTLFTVVDVIDDAGLTDQCFLGVMATDPNGYCVVDTSKCCGSAKLYGTANADSPSEILRINGFTYILGQEIVNDFSYATVSRFDNTNSLVWQMKLDTPSLLVDGVSTDNGELIFVGREEPVRNPNNTWRDNKSLIVKLNENNGSLVTANLYSRDGREAFTRIIKHNNPPSPNSPYYVIGFTNFSSNPNSQDLVHVMNIDDNCQTNWVNSYENTSDDQWARGLTLLPNGNLLLMGDQSGCDGVLVEVSSGNGTVIDFLEASTAIGFMDLKEIPSSSNFLASARTGCENPTASIVLMNSSFELLDAIEFDGRGISNFEDIHLDGNENFYTTGKMTNEALVIIKGSIINNSITVSEFKVLKEEEDSYASSHLAVDGTSLYYTDGRDGHSEGLGMNDILLARFNIDLSEDCLSDTLLSYSQISFGFGSMSLGFAQEVLPIGEPISTSNIEFVCIDACMPDPCEDDKEGPIVNCELLEIVVELDQDGIATIDIDSWEIMATDNCSDVILPEINFTADCEDVGLNLNWPVSISDENGNATTCDLYALIVDPLGACDDPCLDDITDPTCLTQNITVNLEQNGQAIITPEMIDNGSVDDCSAVTLSLDQTMFTCNDVGVNEVTLTVTDESGNSSSCTAEVTIEDKLAPTCITQDITINLDANGMATVTSLAVNAGSNDNCPTGLGFTLSQMNFTCNDLGANLLELLVVDLNGNSSTCPVTVTVLDNDDVCDPTCIFSCTEECSTASVNLSTGIDPVSEAFLSIGDFEANWTLIGSPDPGIQVPRPAFVLDPNPVWDQLPGSQYISAYPDAANNATNIDDDTYYEFEKCFCVCEDISEVTIDLAAYVDNNLEILLYDATGTMIQSLLNITDQTAGAFTGDPEETTTAISLTNGVYCLRARLKNDGSETMGMSIEANVSGIGLIENQCCKSYNAITGIVFQDPECDGLHTGESHLAIAGWEVQLCSGSVVVETVMTDAFGYYTFNNLIPGDYTVKALNPDINQSSTPEQVDVTINDNEVVSINFGYCDVDVCCIDQSVFEEIVSENLKVLVFDCQVLVRPDFEVDECVESIIDWGDGSIETQVGPYFIEHNYTTDGEYELCVETIRRDSEGEICNTFTECRTLCMTCESVCEEGQEQLTAISSFQYPDHNSQGNINKQSDVQYYNGDLYATYSQTNSNGGTDIHIILNGSIVHTISNTIETQVSEIKIVGDYIYLTGSFKGGDMEVPLTLNGNSSLTLVNNCYSAGACLADGFVIKYDLGFGLVWAFRLGGTWIDVVEDITIINDNEFAITGVTRVEADFDPNNALDVSSEPNNTIKAFVAKYTFDNNYNLPQCNWVNTLYTLDAAVSSVHGLGITHDALGNIYCGGDYGSGTAYGNTSAMQLYSSNTNAPISDPNSVPFLVPAGKIFGYVIQYEDNGTLGWSRNLPNPLPVTLPFRNNYVSDLEILNGNLFVAGLNTVAKLDALTGAFDQNLAINPVIEYGIDINELAIANNQIHLIGFVNDTYRNLDLMLPVGQGPQITSPLNMIFSVYDENLDYLKSLNPGGAGIDYGMGITVNGDKIAICGNTTSPIFDPNHPNATNTDLHLNLISDRDFIIAEYECECASFEESPNGCCSDLTSVLKEDDTGDYCCEISIANNQGVSLSSINVDILGGGIFANGQLNIDSDYVISMSSASSIEITHNSGQIPMGTTSPLLEFCLDQMVGTVNEYVVSYVQTGINGNTFISCRDTLNGDCGMEIISPPEDCATLSEINALCQAGKEPVYEVSFTVTNESNSVIEELQLSGLPSGFSWAPCDIDPIQINTFLSIEIPPLSPGQSTQICVRVVANNPVSTSTTLDFIAIMIDEDGKSFCCAHDNSIDIIPCCDNCDDIQIDLVETSSCCYQFTMSGFCKNNDYDELNISAPDGVSIVNSSVTPISSPNQVWFLCDTGNEDLCIAPAQGLFADQVGGIEVTFCLSGNISGTESLTFDFRNDKEDILCTKTESVTCDGGCVSEGFLNPVLYTFGFKNEKIRLECNQPPLILYCPTFSEVFIKGRFDCSSDCEEELSVTVLLDGQEIRPKETGSKDGTWEIRLTELLRNPGLYIIVVEGSCNGQTETCTYSFEIRRDCYECSCNDLEKDMSLLWSINNSNECTVSIVPNGLKECDIVNSYSFNGDIVTGPFSANRKVKYILPASGSYEICMTVSRLDEETGLECISEICSNYKLECKKDGVNGEICESDFLENGGFDLGVEGSLYDNSKALIPGWKMDNGKGYYYNKGGSIDTLSGYVQVIADQKEDVRLSTDIIIDLDEGDSNEVRVFHDAKVRNTAETYTLSLIIGSDTIESPPVYTTHENIWESKMIVFSLSDNQVNTLEQNGEIRGVIQSYCCNDPMVEHIIALDNFCVEVEKLMVNTTNPVGKEVIIFPNPNTGSFTVKITSPESFNGLKIYDILGEQVFEKRILKADNAINLSDLPSGTYVVKIKLKEGETIIKKVILVK